MGPSSLIILIIAAIAFSAGGIAVAKVLVKGTKNAQKGQTYECGVPTIGPSWVQFHVGYYLFALIFLIFDVEIALLFPWVLALKFINWFGFFTMIVFLSILTVGFFYEWHRGALVWPREKEEKEQKKITPNH